MNEEETLQIESETDIASSEDSASVPESETSGSAAESVTEETTIPYEDSIQYDLNYGFGYMSLWFGIVFGCLLVLSFLKGFKK